MKKPNLFILGAPKCGTTALATWLASHPEVFVSAVKEPHYFCEEHRLTPSLDDYEALFAQASEQHRWVCEASVWYLFSDTAVPNIERYSPDARYIVMVRNPLQMAPSLHEQLRFNGNELVKDFKDALCLNDARAMGKAIGVSPGYTQPQQLAYYHSCALGWQVARLLAHVPRERIFLVVMDDLEESAESTYGSILQFLDLPNIQLEKFNRINGAKQRKSYLLDALVLILARMKRRLGIRQRLGILARMRKWNVHYRPREGLPISLKNTMSARFEPDIQVLGGLLSRDLGQLWKVENE